MSASLTWRTTSLDEVLHSIKFCIERNGIAHVYLHGAKWHICGSPQNDMADDHIINATRMTGQKQLETTILRTMLAEVA